MFTSIKVDGFKGIKEGKTSDLAQVNIITGKNNTGKSAFLQSLYLLNPYSDKSIIPYFGKKEMYWGYNQNNPIRYEFESDRKSFGGIYSQSYNGGIEITDFIKNGALQLPQGRKFLVNNSQVFIEPNSLFNFGDPMKYLTNEGQNIYKIMNSSVMLNHFNFLSTTQQVSQMLDRLQNVLRREKELMGILSEAYDTELSDLRYSPHEFQGWSVLLEDGKESRVISLDYLGDGIRTSVNILLKILAENPKTILIDEIEMHQHPKALHHLCKAILIYLKQNQSQLFVSTHSLEAIKILSELSKEQKISTMIHHFILKEGKLEVRSIPSLDADVIVDLVGDVRSIDEYV